MAGIHFDMEGMVKEHQRVHDAIWQEMRRSSDRAVCVLAGAILEARVKKLLMACLADEKSVLDFMFQRSGPLSSAGTQLRMAFLLGLLRRDHFAALKACQDIRNFAAHGEAVSFDSSPLKEHVSKLGAGDAAEEMQKAFPRTFGGHSVSMIAFYLTITNLMVQLDVLTKVISEHRKCQVPTTYTSGPDRPYGLQRVAS